MNSNTFSDHAYDDGTPHTSGEIESENTVQLTGDVTSGTGKAREFLTLTGYTDQFDERLGYVPYPGTLNLTLTGHFGSRRTLNPNDGIPIDSWKRNGRTFGSAVCYSCVLTRAGTAYTEGHVLVPDRTDHDDGTLEIVAPDRLRDALAVDDGDELTVTIPEGLAQK